MNGREGKLDVRTIVLRIGAVVLTIILLLSTGLFLVELWEKNFGKTPANYQGLDTTLSYNGKDYELKKNVETFLVLGLDKFENEESGSYNNDKQADFLTLFVFDHDEKSCKAIQINRDTMAEINVLGVAGDKIGTVNKQIALAHTYGNGKEVSCQNTAYAVSDLLYGVKIDHYMSITMEAVSVCNDLVGGVTVEVLEDLTEVDAALVKGATVTLKGEQALGYIRSRYGLENPTNSSRMERQTQYLKAFVEQARSLARTDEGLSARAALALADYIISDCSASRLESLLRKISSYKQEGVLELNGETVAGERFMEFYPDEHSVTEVVIECFYEAGDEK